MNSLIFACNSLYDACTNGVILAEDDVFDADVLTDFEVDEVDECEVEVGMLVTSIFSSYSSSFGGGGAG